MQTDRVNDGVCGATGSKAAWDAVNALKRGLELKRRPAPIRMKFVDGSSASTAEDNAEVFARHFDGLYLYGCRLPNKKCSQRYVKYSARNSGCATDRSPIKMHHLERYTGLEWHDHAKTAAALYTRA